MYIFDFWTISTSTITAMKAKGSKVMCAFSCGIAEFSRPDFNDFPLSAKGSTVPGTTNDKYLDIHDTAQYINVIAARMDTALSKGCDGILAQNVSTYLLGGGTGTGFTVTAQDQINYITLLATTAHNKVLSLGIMNNFD